MSSYYPKMLVCVDCGNEFEFSARDQEFFAERGFSEPKRCKTCRIKKKARFEGQDSSRPVRSQSHSRIFGDEEL